MKTKVLVSLFALACGLVLFTGCATTPSSTPTVAEAAQVKFVVGHAVLDDPDPIFKTVFPQGYPIKKDPLETTAEFNARLAKLDVQGRERTFLIPPDLCEVYPVPDRDFYVIAAKDELFDIGYVKQPYCVTLSKVEDSRRTYMGQNGFGATAEITSISATVRRLEIQNFRELPLPLRWTSGESRTMHLGLPIRTLDPRFRELIKAGKIALAVRVKIMDPSTAESRPMYSGATIAAPFESSTNNLILPVALQEAWIVDLSTGTTIVDWNPANK